MHQLYTRHHGWLFQFLRRKLGDAEQAADLAQDTFIRLLNTGQRAEIREPRAYLSTIARGLVADMFRRRAWSRLISTPSKHGRNRWRFLPNSACWCWKP